MKKAFTMIELVFVIVVIGILSAVMLPDTKSDRLRGAANQLLSHIRYTQHLAMLDDKFDSVDNDWYKERWQLIFRTTIKETSNSSSESDDVLSCTIFSDKESSTGTAPDGNPNTSNDEIALNPINPDKFLSGGFSSTIAKNHPKRDVTMDIMGKFGVLDIDFLDGCSSAQRIAFDYLGRPLMGSQVSANNPFEKVMSVNCKISICTVSDCSSVSNGDNKVTILIEKETGYARIE